MGVVETVAAVETAVETVAETVAAVATVEIVETVAEKMEVGQVRQVAISDQSHRTTMIAMNQCVVILYYRLYYLF